MSDDLKRGRLLQPVPGAPGSLTTLGGGGPAQTANTSGPLSVTQQFIESTISDATPELSVTQQFIESVLTDATPALRVSQTFIEAVIERDYAWWDMQIGDDTIVTD